MAARAGTRREEAPALAGLGRWRRRELEAEAEAAAAIVERKGFWGNGEGEARGPGRAGEEEPGGGGGRQASGGGGIKGRAGREEVGAEEQGRRRGRR